MKVRLTVKHKKANVKTVVLHSDALIGRSTDCNLRLASGQISRKHCKLLISDERVAIEDLGSSNGTYLNDQKLESNSITTLSTNDVLNIGSVTFIVNYDDPADETQIRKKPSGENAAAPQKTSSVEKSEDIDVTPIAGTPVFAEPSGESSNPDSTDESDVDVDELTDEELEKLLADEGFEEEGEHLSVELKTDDPEASDAEETIRMAPQDNPAVEEEFANPGSDDEKSKEDGDDNEEDVMKFLDGLE